MSSDFQQINDYNFNIDSFVQGNNGAVLRFTVRRKGNIVPIDGATVNVAIKRGQDLFTKNATIISAPSGICEVILTRADLETAGTYYLQPTILFPDDDEFSGDVQKFTVSGKLTGTPTNPGNGGTNPVFTVRDSAINGNILVNGAETVVYDDTGKVDKVAGKGLSTNDYDNTEKAEVAKVGLKADKTYVDTQLADKALFKNTKDTFGTFDTAGVLGILGNSAPGRKLPILGIPPENQSLLSTYPDRDSVALYVENNSASRAKCTNNVSFTSTTVTTTDNISSCKVGMVIDTMHTPNKYSGIVTSIVGNVITVTAWYLVDGVTLTPQTPPNTAGFIINPITKVWGQNMNVYLRNAEDPKSAAAMEIGLFNDKTGGTMWGVDVVSFGQVSPQYGYMARRQQNAVSRIGTGFYAENCTTSYESYQDAASMVAFKASVNNSSQNWFVTSDGMQNKLRVQVQSVGNGVTSPTDANQTSFLFTNTAPLTFTVPTSGGVTGKLLFFYNSGTANVTLSGTGGVVFGGSTTDSSTYLLPPRCFAIFMSNGGVVWFPLASNTNNTLNGTAAPTSTPTFIGQEFLDTTNKKMYKAFGTSNSADWVIMN